MADAKRMKCGGRNGKEQKNENIQVFVRVRPQNTQEKSEKCGKSATVIECNKDREIIVKERSNSTLTKTFTFDRVFAPDSRQIDVYKTVVNPLIDEVLAGYNCTVFAYGQTGTGKTYTMEGERSSADSTWEKDPQCGIVPRVLSHIFDELRMQQLEFTMSVSYLELYNEELIDLLSPIDDTTKLRLFEDAAQKGSLVIQGLQEILVLDKKEVYEIMNKGSQKRQTAATLMNAHSSRSHTIFTVTVHIRESTDDGEELLRTGKINLVDLAGSENIGRSGAKQQRAREAGNINQSLLTLGRVITALVERTPHVPYRESKLTRLLQDSLGGRTKTSIIATVSPVLANLEETLSTLDYAHRAKSITNRPEINQRLTKKALLKEYTTEIERLRRDLEATRDGTGVYVAHENYVHMTQRMEKQDVEISENIQRIRALEEERDKKEAICDRLHMELEEKSQLLEQTSKTLEGTRDMLVNTQEKLQHTEEDRDEKAVLLENHMVTEEVLTTQATTLLEVADQSTTDLQRVHDKLDYKRSLEEQNFQAVQEFKDAFRQKLARMNENIASYTEEHSQQIGDVRSKLEEALQSTRQIDAKAHKEVSSFIDSHSNSLQALETELRQQAESRQQWSHSQLQSTRDTSESQLTAMHAALTESYARNNALMLEVETIKGNTGKALKIISQKSQVENVSGMQRLTMDFSQKMISELQRSQDQITLLREHRETTHKAAQWVEAAQTGEAVLEMAVPPVAVVDCLFCEEKLF
ncbi:hypothetical protein B566_EDAN008646 [Ephemera danica]|nr:hypothetical protein B566_EDAN008646 [Ephemera danica]